MKKMFILLILIIFIFGCLSKTPKSVPNENGFSIDVKKISPSIKAQLKINQKVFVWFSYRVPDNYNKGVYIWLIPKAGGTIPQASPLIKSKSGTITRYFAVNEGNVRIRKIWVRMMDKKQTKILVQKAIKVNFISNPKTNPGTSYY